MLCVWKLLWPSQNTFCPTKQLLSTRDRANRITIQTRSSNVSLRQILFFMTTFQKAIKSTFGVFSLSDLQLHIYLLLFQQPRQSLIYRVAIEWGKSVKTLSFVLLSLPSTRIRRWILAYGLLVANALDLIGQPYQADGYYCWMNTHNLGFSADVCHFNQNIQCRYDRSRNGEQKVTRWIQYKALQFQYPYLI